MKKLFVALLIITLTACASGSKNTQYSLHNAIYEGNDLQAQNLINSGSSINDCDSYGYTPLTAATYSGEWDIAKALIEKGADVNARDGNGYPPLIYAAQYCNEGIVRYFVDHGADPSLKSSDGYNALYCVVQCEENSLWSYLLDMPNIDLESQTIDGQTVYHWAMENMKMELVAALRKRGVTERFENSSAGKFDESLRAPSRYTPPSGLFEVEPGREYFYKLAIEDCNHMVVPYKKGLLFAAGPIGYGVGMIVDKVRVPGKFQQCMEVMGFKCLNKQAAE